MQRPNVRGLNLSLAILDLTMRLDLGLLNPDRSISDRPIDEIGGRAGRFAALPTPEQVECQPFRIFGESHFTLHMKRPLPRRSISTIANCLVHGESAALLTLESFGRAVHWSALPELSLGGFSANYSRFFEQKRNRWRFPSNPKLSPTRRFEKGVLIGSRFSFNYFHFMLDSLVRALIADEHGFSDWPVVITKSPYQIAELVDLFSPGREIITLEPDDLAHFDNLVVPVSSSFSPDDPRLTTASVSDVPYLPELRSRLQGTPTGTESSGGKVLYLKRPVYAAPAGSIPRTIANQDEVIDCVESLGATVISPEAMSAREQRAALRDADVVISMAGSALANAVFCRPGATIILICQNAVVSPEYFGIVFDALGLNYIVVACPPVAGSNSHASHLSVTVDTKLLRRAFESARGMAAAD